MNIFSLFGITFIPVIAIFCLFKIFIPEQKISYSLWACLAGLFTVIPTAFVQYFVLNLPIFNSNTLISVLITAVIFNGLIEEAFKMAFIALIPMKKQTLPAFFACCLLYGMTLGCFESIIYLVKRLENSAFDFNQMEFYKLIFSRMFTAVLIHTFCAGLSGLYLWLFRHKQNHISPFIFAVLLHGIYNFFAGFQSNFYFFSIVAILFAALECRIWYKSIRDSAAEPQTE